MARSVAQPRSLRPAHVGRRAGRRPVVRPAAARHRGGPPRRGRSPVHVGLGEGKGLPGRHRQLQAHEVEPGDQLGHPVLHLEAGVHLQEVEATGIDQVLHGAGARVADRPGHRHGGLPHLPAGRLGHQDGRRLLHHLLVPALDRALPVEQVQHGAVGVPDDLDLDVTGGLEVALEEHLVRTEGGRPPRAGPPPRHRPVRPAHARGACRGPPPPADALTRRGYPTPAAAAQRAASSAPVATTTLGRTGTPACGRHLLGPRLVPHDAHGLGRRPDPDDAGRRTGLGQGGVLGQEPVAGMQGVGPGRLRPPPPARRRRDRSRRATRRGAAPRRRPRRHGGWPRRRPRRRRRPRSRRRGRRG